MAGENTLNYGEQGGSHTHIGGKLTIDSGGQFMLGTAQVAGLTTIGVAVLSTSQTSALTTTQLSALCVNNDLIVTALKNLGLAS